MLLRSHRLLSLTASLLLALLSVAQTPVANRVKAVVAHLPRQASVVAKYTDVYRHCLYFTMANRLYQYDVLTDRQHDVSFTGNSYAHIITTWLSPDGNFFFIAVDRGNLSSFYLDDGQEVWRYDSRKHKTKKIGQGFCIEVQKGCIVIKRASRCLNPDAAPKHQQWMAQDHYYDLYGNIIWAKDEYKVPMK